MHIARGRRISLAQDRFAIQLARRGIECDIGFLDVRFQDLALYFDLLEFNGRTLQPRCRDAFICLCAFQGSFGCFHIGPVFGVIELCEELAFLDKVVEVGGNARNLPGELGADFHGDRGIQRTGRNHRVHEVRWRD